MTIHRIVCAANRKRFTGEVVQGFIDNKGNFMSVQKRGSLQEKA